MMSRSSQVSPIETITVVEPLVEPSSSRDGGTTDKDEDEDHKKKTWCRPSNSVRDVPPPGTKPFTLMDRQICLQGKFEKLAGFSLTMGGFSAFVITQFHNETFDVLDASGNDSLDMFLVQPNFTRVAVALTFWSFIFNMTSGMIAVLFQQFLANDEYQEKIMPKAQPAYSMASTFQGLGGMLFLSSVVLFSLGTQLHHWMTIVTLVLAIISLIGIVALFIFMGANVMPYKKDGNGYGIRPEVSSD